MTGTQPDPAALLAYEMPRQQAVVEVIRCVRCWTPVTDEDDLIRTPFAATGQPSVAHRECPDEEADRG